MKRFELLIPPPIVAIIIVAIQYGAYKLFPNFSFFWFASIMVSVILILVGLVLATLGIITFKKHLTTSNPKKPQLSAQIVSTGIYKISRNPMYLGNFVWIVRHWILLRE